MSPRSDETTLITTDPGPVETEERRKGMFAPLFRFRRSTATTLTRATNKREQKKHPDESSTVDETDDEFSSSSSFDLIDSILGSAVESPITDKALLTTPPTTPPTATPTATPDVFAANTNLTTVTYETVPDNTLHSCLKLLSSKDLDLNRVGLQRLVMLTKGRTLSGLYHSEEVASHVLVFGGPLGSVEERLRFIFATMICDAPHDDHEDEDEYYLNLNSNLNLTTPAFSDEEDALFDWILDYDPTKSGVEHMNTNNTNNPNNNDDDDDDKSSYCSSYSEDEDEYESSQHPQGKADGVLHNHALRILANALCKVASSSSSSTEQQQQPQHQQQQLSGIMTKIPIIPLHGTLWKNITRSLVDNIETNRNADATGYSLKILRLLHAIHPEMIVPVLRTVLFPHLVHLTEYGANHQFPMIYSEASYLYKIATSEPKHKQLTAVTN